MAENFNANTRKKLAWVLIGIGIAAVTLLSILSQLLGHAFLKDTAVILAAVIIVLTFWTLINNLEEKSPQDNEEDRPVCPVCLAPIAANSYFCDACQAPISSHSTLDPMKQIYSTGWMYRKALSGRVSWIVLVGLWIIFLPTFLFGFVFLFFAVKEGFTKSDLIGNFTSIGLSAISAIILYRGTRGFFCNCHADSQLCEENERDQTDS